MTTLTFRRATVDDVPAIVAMLADDPLGAKRERFETPLPESYLRAFAEIDADANNELVVACLDGGQGAVVGVLQLTFIPYLTHQGSRRALIEGVRVASSHRSAGFGTQLTVPELEFMHIHKTGAIIRAAAQLGVRCGETLSAADCSKIDHFAKCIGLAFQVVDDVLDAESTTATLGKTAGKDAQSDKPTYVSAIGVQRSKDFARELRDDAIGALCGFGDRARRLAELADFIVMREF